jgi:hypothetical protein
MSVKGFALRKVAGTVGLLVLGQPAMAECTSGGCLDGIVMFFASILAYGIIALVLLVMIVRAKWRRAGFRALGLVAALALGVPLVSQGWQSWKLAAMERREVAGQPPALTGRGVLLIPQGEACYNDACMSVLIGRGAAGAYVLPEAAMEGLDLTRPIPLADLPLQLWRAPGTTGGEALRRTLSTVERQRLVGSIDYVVLTAEPFFLSSQGPIEAALRSHPDLSGMRAGELLRFAMGPLTPGILSLTEMRFDVLDLWLLDPALAIPLAPGNWQPPDNTSIGVEAATKVLCWVPGPTGVGEIDWGCRSGLE